MARVVRESIPVGNYGAEIHSSEPFTRNRGSRHPYRRCHVHRARWSLVSIRQTLSREVLGAVQGFWCLPLVLEGMN
jgi:hypothetical protein